MEKFLCSECDNVYEKAHSLCPNCGCPSKYNKLIANTYPIITNEYIERFTSREVTFLRGLDVYQSKKVKSISHNKDYSLFTAIVTSSKSRVDFKEDK